MFRRLTMNIPIVLALGAVVLFPVLKMAGIEIKSSYVVAFTVAASVLALVVIWRFVRRLVNRSRDR